MQADRQIQPCPPVRWTKECNEVSLGDDLGRLEWKSDATSVSHPNQQTDIFPQGVLTVSSRVDVEEAVIYQGGMHKSLKKLFQSSGIPPWLRNSIPLCSLDGKLVALGDWYFDEQFAAWLSAYGYCLSWRPQHPLLQYILHQQHANKQ